MRKTELIQLGTDWFNQRDWEPLDFQVETWEAYLAGYHGILNAPTGSGKTYALLMPIVLQFINKHKDYRERTNNGLQAIWIAPIRALTKEIESAATQLCLEMGLQWQVGVRTGDTTASQREKQLKQMPEILITTPESLHVLLARKKYVRMFKKLQSVVVDEWHELLGTKRAVQVELALSRYKGIRPKLQVWGISATIGNLEEAMEVLLGSDVEKGQHKMVFADIKKEIEVTTLLPDEIEKYPWAGHMGLRMLPHILPIIKRSKTTLVFTNTRAMAEIWYQNLLKAEPDLAGQIALHHGSIDKNLRNWVETELHSERMKAVVCTSSLDLGVDFRPVESVVQVGSPKGVARFVQRAGRSGHQPGATSRIYFLPTNSLELIEASALRKAMQEGNLENRFPHIRSFDVLVQYMCTLAVSDGFFPEELYREVQSTFCYNSVSPEEWGWLLDFITTGGSSLQGYDEYRKVAIQDSGLYQVTNRRVAQRHRMSIGTIVSEPIMHINFVSGKRLGSIEEYFISRLNPGDIFGYAGRSLELVRVSGMTAQVRVSKKRATKIPSWRGARMPLSSQLSAMLRFKINEALRGDSDEPELKTIYPLIAKQQELSHVPSESEFLIEKMQTEEGHHVFMYTFEGRLVNEGMASLVAYRISLLQPITVTIAMNDYGFELLSDQEIPIETAIDSDIFTADHLHDDILASINAAEMARRQFRDIANISGLIFKGFPGKWKKDRHLQSSSQLFFEVFNDYEPTNLLLRQAFEEVTEFQLEENRMREAMNRINEQEIILTYPEKFTPFSFPLFVDRLRESTMTSEKLEDRIRKMKLELEKD